MSASDVEAGREGAAADRLIRHRLPDRIFHWVMAASVLALLVTGFVPVLGLKFPWVTPHWIAGLVLAAALLFHVARAPIRLDLGSMAIGPRDVRDAWCSARWVLGRTAEEPPKPGKYPLSQKLYHHAAAAVLLVTVGTGLPMLSKIDTPLWRRDPYWLAEQTWGVIYVLHGLAAFCVLTLIMAHVYFALRPEKLWFTRSMILGWITRKEYLDFHDAKRWVVTGEMEAGEGPAAAASPSAAGARDDP